MIHHTIEDLKATLPKLGKLLGLDVGTKTIGLALSDRTRMLATPMKTLVKSKVLINVEELQGVIHAEDVVGLVIGLPLNMNGTEGPRCDSVRDFAKNIGAHIDLPICFWDERLSTVAATDMMIEADLSRKKQKLLVDKIAASLILQPALDRLRR